MQYFTFVYIPATSTGTCSVNCWTGINDWSIPVKEHIYPARSFWQSTNSFARVKLSLADHRGRREPVTLTPGIDPYKVNQ